MTTDQTNANTNAHSPSSTTAPVVPIVMYPNGNPTPNAAAGVVQTDARTNALKNSHAGS